MPRHRHVFAATVYALLLTGCTTHSSSVSRLDSSGLTVVTLTEAIVFARTDRTLAASARDYAFIGPIEINRMGDRQYYLWVSLASTVDRDLVGLDPTNAVALMLVVDEVPMEMPLVEWDTTLDGPPYHSSAPIYATLAAHTSLDQIHRIATADAVELHLLIAAGHTARYEHWRGEWKALSEFARDN